ncbi:MAG: hypothetical protein IJR06_00635 [Paludibacteraceae bacterium]|nr:hypothetical protein [Paludibacteraceae bacterium]
MNITENKDTQLAIGAAVGSSANIIGHGAVTIVGKAIATKCVGAGFLKAGAILALSNPAISVSVLTVSCGYLICRKLFAD